MISVDFSMKIDASGSGAAGRELAGNAFVKSRIPWGFPFFHCVLWTAQGQEKQKSGTTR